MKPKFWKKKSQEEIKTIVFNALKDNVNYQEENILGIPASFLEEKVFYQDASFLEAAPFISTLIQNPNHIGCHTLGQSESFFKGTQKIEKALIEICAVDILRGNPFEQDGYVASGGTEANLQAIWIYRNYFRQEYNASLDQIAILTSEDAHYSMQKASNVLNIDLYEAPVFKSNRNLDIDKLKSTIRQAQQDGKQYFIVIANMMTTMFGSVDNVEIYTSCLKAMECPFKLHIDGAYGGFYHPFTEGYNDQMSFKNNDITSFTLDAHKMAQAPYGTGIFLIRKDYMQYANTDKASYVEGEDYTLIGSRSGANAVAVWMILTKIGPYGWYEKVLVLQNRTEWMCNELESLDIKYFRYPDANIITIQADYIQAEVAHKFGLVPDNHNKPEWYKIVIMEHVTVEKLLLLIEALKSSTIPMA